MNPFIANPRRLFANMCTLADLASDRRSRWFVMRDQVRANLARMHDGWSGLATQLLGTAPVCVQLRLPDQARDVAFWYRPGTTDLSVLEQVFLDREYEASDGRCPGPDEVEYIVDLGSNIGVTALMWAGRFPRARMLLVEPDEGNFALLERNTAYLGDRCLRRRAAVADADGPVRFYRYSRDYGHSIVDRADYRDKLVEAVEVPGVTLESLIAQSGFPRIDVLKVDIEGSEAVVLPTIATWSVVPRAIVAELHAPYRFADFASDCQRVGLTAWPAVPDGPDRRPLPWAGRSG